MTVNEDRSGVHMAETVQFCLFYAHKMLMDSV